MRITDELMLEREPEPEDLALRIFQAGRGFVLSPPDDHCQACKGTGFVAEGDDLTIFCACRYTASERGECRDGDTRGG